MAKYPYKLVDVFTDNPLEGNQLAVVLGAEGLTDEKMLAITREFNHSETTFVLPARNKKAAWRLRSFTLAEEVFSTGHHTLGAWWAIAGNGFIDLPEDVNVVYQEIGDEIFPLEIYAASGRAARVLMTQADTIFGKKFEDIATLAAVVGLDASDLYVESLGPQAVSTGAFHFLVPVKSLEAIKKVQIDSARLIELARPLGCHGCYLYTLETVNADSAAHARGFMPGIGMKSEDPATGSAAGPLGAYLVSKGILPEGKSLIIEQGYQVHRPSNIEVLVNRDEIKIGGRCVVVGEGTLNL